MEKISVMAETNPQLPKVLESVKGLNQERVVAEAAKFLDSKEGNMRRAAIYILWRGEFSSVEPAAPQLLRLCEHEEDLTRGMAAITLGANHIAKSLPVLIKNDGRRSQRLRPALRGICVGPAGQQRGDRDAEKGFEGSRVDGSQ